ncbi:hypothetical protein ACJJTC_000448 [Scirpophaga incertulas]
MVKGHLIFINLCTDCYYICNVDEDLKFENPGWLCVSIVQKFFRRLSFYKLIWKKTFFRYMWAPPMYDYQKFIDQAGSVEWIGRVELPAVGAPLLSSPRHLGPLTTRPCHSMQQAHVEAAENALHYIKCLRTDILQRSVQSIHNVPSVFPVQTVPNCVPLPTYDYLTPMYPNVQMPLPTIWRTV